MKSLIAAVLVLFAVTSHADVEVLFHPKDPTLEKIGSWLSEARGTADIAMYNMDVTDSSPVIQALKSATVRGRIENGELKIRLIYEGYGTPDENKELMGKLEELGIDARYLGKSAKVHHKFALITAGERVERVISGSANWSLSSYRNYDENILFFKNEAEVAYRFRTEFNRLWSIAKEYGKSSSHALPEAVAADESDLTIHFNSPRILKSKDEEQIQITDQIVRLIDEAKKTVDIATTRIRLEPVLDAVARAADRGVQVRILISQDDYHDLNKRSQWLLGKKNIELRVKFYNLRAGDYMTFQMHNKFLIVDGKTVASGSFNWSKSGETAHIENLIEMRDGFAKQVLPRFEDKFETLWNLGRDSFAAYQESLTEQSSQGQVPKCGFRPVALEYEEIKKLLSENPKCR